MYWFIVLLCSCVGEGCEGYAQRARLNLYDVGVRDG